eukprot:CAMPEP_0113453914 /NCGR_PEP_ID=MMETSP0014_2-20120614/7598_1 /TAXON_ID=2857 /ORGANISM="Nitzschia sp." /LENGTH=544 /DNA_ID=CAMNT_0000345313 /DNA_START=46 /DNA_END=1680 /DNA_ORIENTATION=- /assembly_acc=CAM_ASM_000159
MSDQKALKKRLKALMAQPHNQICIDCNEKKPTWASLIVPPPGCPPGTEKMGAFVCLECSGSHRRLGVHIAFVRSVNLDAWKDWEVIAMENGGNSKINAIFEAKLAQSGRQKLTNLDNGPTRERYIRDKYERRKFYDPAAFSQDFSALQAAAAAAAGSAGASGGSGGGGPRPGAPSDIARQRVASRQARMKPAASNITDAHSSSYNASAASAPGRKVAQAPVSAPVTVDLLDFGSPAPAAPAPAAAAATSTDLFGGDPFSSPAAPAPIAAPAATQQTPAPTAAATSSTGSSTFAQELMSNPAPAKPATSNDSIMALFGGPPKQQSFAPQSYGMQAMAGMNPTGVNNGNMQGMQATGMNPQMMQQQQMMMMQQQQQQQQQQQRQGQQMMGMNMNNAGVGGGGGGMMMNNNNMQGMMTPQMQQQMMMAQQMQMQQQKQMPQQQQMNGNMGGMNMMTNPATMNNMMGSMNNNNSSGATAPNNMMNNNFNAAMMGMQNMNMGGGGGAGGIAKSASGDDGGFGAPMGGNASNGNSANDAFASLGGMNAFR